MDTGMQFETTVRLFLGQKAYHIANAEDDKRLRRKWLTKVAKVISVRVNDLETTTRHKRMLMSQVDAITSVLNNSSEASWKLVYHLFALCGGLLGFHSDRGRLSYTVVYHQTLDQHYMSDISSRGNVMQGQYDREDAISIRKEIVETLTKKGLDDFKLALVLNTSEYEVKKLRLGL